MFTDSIPRSSSSRQAQEIPSAYITTSWWTVIAGPQPEKPPQQPRQDGHYLGDDDETRYLRVRNVRVGIARRCVAPGCTRAFKVRRPGQAYCSRNCWRRARYWKRVAA